MPKNNTPANSTPNFVHNLVRKHKHPKLMEMFIYGALVKYAEDIAELNKDEIALQMEHGAEWHDCATDILTKIDKKFPGREIT